MNKFRLYEFLLLILFSILITPSAIADEERLKTTGFATITLSQTDGDYPYVQGEIDNYSFRPRSLAGLQFDYTVNDETAFVVQATASAVESWDAKFEWAFFRYKLMPNVFVRAGRMRTPGFMLSDYVKIGYAYPWISPPAEVYGRADSAMDGMDLIYRGSLSDSWSFYVRPYAGTIEDTPGVITSDLLGLDLNFSSETLTLSLGYRAAKNTFSESYALEDAIDQIYGQLAPLNAVRPEDSRMDERRVGFYSAGFTYDDGSLLVMGEYTGYTWQDETFVPDATGYYLMAGWRFGKVMPHLTFSKMRSDEDSIYDFPSVTIPGGDVIDPINDFLNTNLNADQETWTLGVRWDFRPNVAFKAEWQRIGGFNDTSGLFAVPFATSATEQIVLDEDDPDINLYRIALTGTF